MRIPTPVLSGKGMRQMRCGRRCLALFIACLLALLGLSHAGAALAEGGVHMITLDQAGQTSAADEEELEGGRASDRAGTGRADARGEQGRGVRHSLGRLPRRRGRAGAGPVVHAVARKARRGRARLRPRHAAARHRAAGGAGSRCRSPLFVLAVLAALLRGALGRLGLSFISAPTLVSLAGLLALLAPRYVAAKGCAGCSPGRCARRRAWSASLPWRLPATSASGSCSSPSAC